MSVGNHAVKPAAGSLRSLARRGVRMEYGAGEESRAAAVEEKAAIAAATNAGVSEDDDDKEEAASEPGSTVACADGAAKLTEGPGQTRRKFSGSLFICSFGCGATFSKNWRLEAHLCRHTGEKPFACEYEGCNKSYSRKGHLARHILIHKGEKPFRCTDERCNQTFTTKDNLKKHLSRKHDNKEKLYLCDFERCGRSFKKHQHLKVHQYEHTRVPSFKCNYEGCDKRFCLPSKLKRHEKVHAGYACKVESCSFIGKTWTELLSHKQKQHKEPFICSECGKKFKRKDTLQAHLKIHAEEREVFRCPREGCERTYTTSFNLQSHILSFHEQQRNFVCEHSDCKKAFSMKQSLDRHSVVHDPKKQKLKAKQRRPKRSLASRLTGYIPPRNQPAVAMITLSEMLEKAKMSEIKNKTELMEPLVANVHNITMKETLDFKCMSH
ncbi:transcription factor IIIA-like [Mobula birostris]|uniref:transcription factor IIIA-like n=1 Tax=Mobula birostris TaxID=1983395 RepID=UPI003B2843D4